MAAPSAFAQVASLLPELDAPQPCQPALLCEAGLIGPEGEGPRPTGALRFFEDEGEAPQGDLWAGVAAASGLEQVVSVAEGQGSLTSVIHLTDRLTLWSEAFVNTIQPNQPQLVQFGWLQALSITLGDHLYLDVGVDVGLPGLGQGLTSFLLISFDQLHRSLIPSFVSTNCAFASQGPVSDE
ncbi:MAG: hypothetical protein SFW67_04940 [Myxococcaceae bacterium]|nr:hypothetical protein [Myxococcaceae bacterium]